MSDDIKVTLTYSEREAREVARAIRYFDSNVTATHEDHDRMALIATAIQLRLPPPKPAEPTGLGAVVEAIYDNHFVHIGGGNWQRVSGDEFDQTRPYADIDVVRIVSEGVTQ